MVFPGVTHVLTYQHEIWLERSDDFGGVAEHHHGDVDAALGRSCDGDFAEFGLFHANVPIAEDLATTEVL